MPNDPRTNVQLIHVWLGCENANQLLDLMCGYYSQRIWPGVHVISQSRGNMYGKDSFFLALRPTVCSRKLRITVWNARSTVWGADGSGGGRWIGPQCPPICNHIELTKLLWHDSMCTQIITQDIRALIYRLFNAPYSFVACHWSICYSNNTVMTNATAAEESQHLTNIWSTMMDGIQVQ